MDSALDIIKLIEAICIGLAAIGGGVAIVVKIIKVINDNHDRYQKYDKYDERITNLDKKIEEMSEKQDVKIKEAHTYAQKELESIKQEMNGKLEEMQTDVNAKFQQISSELCMLSYCVGATLDGLKQLNCNGEVSEAKKKMDKHLNQQAHGET